MHGQGETPGDVEQLIKPNLTPTQEVLNGVEAALTSNNILTKNEVSLLADLVKGIKELSGEHDTPFEHQV